MNLNTELNRCTEGEVLKYQPSDDTYLILDSLAGYRGKSALEIGVGSGIILKELCKRFSVVVGTDIDFNALSFCNQSDGTEADLVCCDGRSSCILAEIRPYCQQPTISSIR